MNFFASSDCGASKNCAAAPVSITRPRCSSTISPAMPSRFAEIVSRHHHLDAARGDGADDVFDRLGGRRIEARGRLVKEQHGGIFRERARQREPLLLAAGDTSRRPLRQSAEADERQQFGRARGALRARRACRGQRVADIARDAAAKHGGTLEHHGAPRRGRMRAAAPGDASMRRRNQSHGKAKQRGLASAVRADQHCRRSASQGQ